MRKNIEKYVVHNKKNVVHVKDIFLNIKYDIYKFLKFILNFVIKCYNLNFQDIYNKMIKFQFFKLMIKILLPLS